MVEWKYGTALLTPNPSNSDQAGVILKKPFLCPHPARLDTTQQLGGIRKDIRIRSGRIENGCPLP